ILDLLDTAKAANDTAILPTLRAQEAAKRTEYNTAKSALEQLNIDYLNLELQLVALYGSINQESNFTEALMEELALFTDEGEWVDDAYIDAQELYDAGVKKFNEYKTPKISVKTGLGNIMEMAEYEYYWDKVVLGDLIKVKHSRMNLTYYARIVEINIDEENESIDITVANASKALDSDGKLAEIIRGSDSASKILASSKHKWDFTSEQVNFVQELMNAEYDANKRKIMAGVNNSIEIGKRGIIVRSPQFPNEVIVIQSGIIALSKDNGNNWQTAITPDGIIAERLMRTIIAGQNLIITNDAGSFVIDNKGLEINMDSIVIKSGGKNVVTDWNKNITDVTNLSSQFSIAQGKINLLVTENNQIKGYDIANSITLNPQAISLISSKVTKTGSELVSSIIVDPQAISLLSQNINITGKVTFNSLDPAMQANINTFNGWKTVGKTTINGGLIETGSVKAVSIDTTQL